MDEIIRAITSDGYLKAYVINSTETIRDAQGLHQTGKVASAALGRALTAALILANDMKNETDRVSVQFRSEGPIGNVVAEANGQNQVKGFVSNPDVVLPLREDGKLDVGGALGHKGTLTIVRDIGLKEPYVGTVELISGEIAEDISYYYMQSEQIPTVLGLGVLVAQNFAILSAGGFMIQLLPGAPDSIVDKVEENVKALPKSISALIADGKNATEILGMLLTGFDYQILSKKEPSYRCDCSRYRVETALISLGKTELQKMIEEEDTTEVSCHYCNKKYHFSKEDLEMLLRLATK
ncbi:MAG: Hsp33 family molecular chaperone HslO [Ruminococcaceae bacterium]|nr:Hsp33 family molecular chaperone HslO [Oscillospiraceae bacterium]